MADKKKPLQSFDLRNSMEMARDENRRDKLYNDLARLKDNPVEGYPKVDEGTIGLNADRSQLQYHFAQGGPVLPRSGVQGKKLWR